MTHWRAGVLALLLLVSLGACATPPPSREAVTLPPESIAPEAIVAAFERRWQSAEDLRALARIAVTSAQGRYSTRQTFFWRRPALVRLDTVGLFGQPTMTLVADPARASVYYPQQGAFLQGPATAATLAQVIGLPLDVEDVPPLLMGALGPLLTEPMVTAYLQTDAGMYLLRFLGPDGKLIQDVWVEPEQLLPRRALRYTKHGVPAVDVAYSDFRHITEGFPFPFELVIWVAGLETEVRIQFLTVELNPGLPPSIFQLSPPAGVPVTPLQ
jgi:outer membrane lipoprotein-sorting protein